jgi:hypothetical protein
MNRRKFLFGLGLLGFLVTDLKLVVASTLDYYLLAKDEPHCHNDEGKPIKPAPTKPKSKKSNYKWIRGLNAKELRVFLKTFKAPYVGVWGMSVTYHLTNHHGFLRKNLRGLTQAELFKLHSAAHYGY